MPKKKKPAVDSQQEAAQIDEIYNALPGNNAEPVKKKKSILKILLIIFLIPVILIGGFIGLTYVNTANGPLLITHNTILESGVTLAGVGIGGMTRDEAIAAVTAQIADSYTTTTMVANLYDQTLEISPAESGANLNVEGAVRAAYRYGTEANPETKVDIIPYLSLNTEAIHQKIQEFAQFFPTEGITTQAEVIKETVDGKEQELMTFTLGTDYYLFSADSLNDAIINAYSNHDFEADYNCDKIIAETIDIDALYAELCTEAVEAVFDATTHEVTQSSTGYRFDLDGAKEALAAAKPGDVLQFPFYYVDPAMDTDTLKSMLFRDELGSYTATQWSSNNRATNLKLACQSLNGIILYPGDTFSYNEALGERTAAKGYKPADSYMGSKTVQTYGGGICQPSSCLYYSTLLADLEIVERSCHGFVSSYMPKGMDATVDWAGPDFKFRNNTDFPIRIEAKANGGEVTVKLIGTDTKDYYVKMEAEVLGVSYPTTIYKKVKAGSGYRDGQVETTPYTGYTVQTYKLKYNKETDELISREKEAYSVYSRRDKVVYKVIKEKKKKEPSTSETTPPDTSASYHIY